MKLKKELPRIDEQLTYWRKIVDRFPRSEGYKRIVYQLEQYRVDRANTIGRKK